MCRDGYEIRMEKEFLLQWARKRSLEEARKRLGREYKFRAGYVNVLW